MSQNFDDSDATDVRTVLDTLDTRESFVEQLADGPMWKRELQEELRFSRSTVYKAVRDLKEQGLVERRDDGYGLTLIGRLLFERRRRFHDVADAIYRSAPLLAALPSDVDIPSTLLVAADVVFAERFAPNQPVLTIESLVRDTDSLKGLSPVVLPQYVDVFHDELVFGDLQAELLLERPVVEHLCVEYERPFDEASEAGDLLVHTTDETLMYGMLLLGTPIRCVVLIVHGPNGELCGLIINETPAAIGWGEDSWGRHLANADPVCSRDE